MCNFRLAPSALALVAHKSRSRVLHLAELPFREAALQRFRCCFGYLREVFSKRTDLRRWCSQGPSLIHDRGALSNEASFLALCRFPKRLRQNFGHVDISTTTAITFQKTFAATPVVTGKLWVTNGKSFLSEQFHLT